MNVWRDLSEIVSRCETREFLQSIEELPSIVRLAYASALTTVQLRIDKAFGVHSFFFAFCFHFEQNCKACLANRDGKCWFSNPDIVDPIVFADRLYLGIIKRTPKEYIYHGDKQIKG